jgi:hypothetical protein
VLIVNRFHDFFTTAPLTFPSTSGILSARQLREEPETMAFMNPMQQFGGGIPGGGFPGGGFPGGGGGGLMGQLARGTQDGSLVGKERMIAGRATMDAKLTEMAAKLDGVVTPQERMAIMAKKCKASCIMNKLRSNGMGNVSREALARQQMGHGGHAGHGGPGGFGGPGAGQFAWGGPQVAGPQAVGGVGNVSVSTAFSSGGGTAQAFAGPRGAFASAGF